MREKNLGNTIEKKVLGVGRKGMWLVAIAAMLAWPVSLPASQGLAPLEQQVRHQLLMLPYNGVFDNLSFQVEGNTVTLMGQVVRPFLRNDAVSVVKGIPGVANVVDKIQVLPLSPFDNRIRVAELRAIYGNSALLRYNVPPVAPIRIIVDNGHVTLDGVVANKMDKDIAGIAANAVPGVFSVTNNLQVGS